MKRCIVSADGFALNAAVDEGILALLDDQAVSATSCLTRSPRWPYSSRSLGPRVGTWADVGVHIDLTEFEILAPNHTALVLACYVHSVDVRRLQMLLLAQFERFEEAMGRPPDFVDGHRHVHQLPVVRDVLIELLARRYPQRPPWIRVSRDDSRFGWKGQLVSRLGGEALHARCRGAGLASNTRLLGLHEFTQDAAVYRTRLQRCLSSAVDGDVLMCRPAARAEVDDPAGPARRAEFEVLSSPWWKACLSACEIRLSRGKGCLTA